MVKGTKEMRRRKKAGETSKGMRQYAKKGCKKGRSQLSAGTWAGKGGIGGGRGGVGIFQGKGGGGG